MADQLLKAYWIKTPNPGDPLGFGVTAWSLEDAFEIVQGMGYELPGDVSRLTVIENIRVADIDQSYVLAHMGPILVRGLWYPFRTLGVPAWMVERGVSR